MYKNNLIATFYCRFPDEDRGFISGIELKEFLSVTGDGTSTIRDLILESERSILQFDVLREEYKDELNEVLPKGETKLLVPYGNHIRGAKFTNGAAFIDEPLTEAIDAVCKQIKGFYFGRLDIRYSSWDELKKGRFSIVELNGAGSEPTHIYDPKHSLAFAWKEIARHLKILYSISKVNHQPPGIPYMSFTAGVQLFRQHFTHLRNLG